ncbi:MAG: hypothetical protein AAF490_26420 [Chloroflexota bacterium]
MKKAFLQDPIAVAAPMETEFDKRPFQKIILSPEIFALHQNQKFALWLILTPTLLILFISLIRLNWTWIIISGIIALLFGLVVAVTYMRSGMVWKVTYHTHSIEVEDGRYGNKEFWIEPLTNFKGITQQFGVLQKGNERNPDIKVYGVFLEHEDPFKSILLHADYDPIPDDVLTYYKTQLFDFEAVEVS